MFLEASNVSLFFLWSKPLVEIAYKVFILSRTALVFRHGRLMRAEKFMTSVFDWESICIRLPKYAQQFMKYWFHFRLKASTIWIFWIESSPRSRQSIPSWKCRDNTALHYPSCLKTLSAPVSFFPHWAQSFMNAPGRPVAVSIYTDPVVASV